jgi:hypothetical protein
MSLTLALEARVDQFDRRKIRERRKPTFGTYRFND